MSYCKIINTLEFTQITDLPMITIYNIYYFFLLLRSKFG